MNFILGSGIIGCLAAKILGPEWQLIPFKRSRYFTFEIPYSDNFITYDANIDDFMSSLVVDHRKLIYKVPFSFQGQLFYELSDFIVDPYLKKVYGPEVPDVASKLLKTTYTIYGTTAKQLHDRLQSELSDTINDGIGSYGDLFNIKLNEREIITKNGVFKYDKIISTIPLDALLKMCGMECELKSKAVCYYNINTKKVDLEGASQCYVADPEIEFFKVVELEKDNYVFWTSNVIDGAYKYFGSFLGYDLDIIEARRIDSVIPIDNPPDLSVLRQHDVNCVGSNAQWDDGMCIGSCIKRLLRLRSS